METSEILQGSSDIPPAPPVAKGAIYALLVVFAITQLQRHYVHDLYDLPYHLYHKVRRQSHVLLQPIRDSFGPKRQWRRGKSGENGSALASLPQKLAGISGVNNHRFPSIMTPPGLGNLDSSCYQNSVIQALSSLSLFSQFVKNHTRDGEVLSMKSALIEMIETLNNPNNAGKLFWLPSKLKNMSSWQQQDAQEYFAKVLEEIECEISQSLFRTADCASLTIATCTKLVVTDGVKAEGQSLGNNSKVPPYITREFNRMPSEVRKVIRDPMEGLMAQRVGCLRCGHSEGLSMTPFKCLTMSIREDWVCPLKTCLDDFIALESINGVECAKCTLLKNQTQVNECLSRLRSSMSKDIDANDLSTQRALLRSFEERLETIESVMDKEDYSDSALKRCQLSNKHRVMTTKTRQAVFARIPESLCIHINRSIFDDRTGAQMKNTAQLQFPKLLSLGPWCLGHETSFDTPAERMTELIEFWLTDPRQSLASQHTIDVNLTECHQLKAVITHQGRHENGHYICYRRHSFHSRPSTSEDLDNETWWRFSDETVTEVDENFVLNQGGVFMLFYEKLESPVDAAASCNTKAPQSQKECLTPVNPTNSSANQSLLSSAITPDGSDHTDTLAALSDEPLALLDGNSSQTSEISSEGDTPLMANRDSDRPETDEKAKIKHCLDGDIGLDQRQTDELSGSKHHQAKNAPALVTQADETAKLTHKQTIFSSQNESMHLSSDKVPKTQRLPTPPRSESGSIGDGNTDFKSPIADDHTPTSKDSNTANDRIYPSPPASPTRLQP